MDDDFLESARREEARLLWRLAAVRALITNYVGGDRDDLAAPTNTAVKRNRAARSESQAALSHKNCREFLTIARRRALSAEIYREIAGRGFTIPGRKPESVVLLP